MNIAALHRLFGIGRSASRKLGGLILVVALTMATTAVGCGPKNKFCPENGGPCFPPDVTPDGGTDGEVGDGGDTGAPADVSDGRDSKDASSPGDMRG